MAGRVPEHVIQQVLRGVDFVRLVGRHCELKKKGKKFWALCPFHKEKTPSFSIDPENGLYYCFGCKEGGNAFTFLQQMEGLSFGEALRKLAAEAGVDLAKYRGQEGPSRGELSRLREINELATSFYQKCLEKGRGGETARSYLAGRGIGEEAVALWRLGYAPDGWEHLLKCALGRGYEADLLVKAGLALAREGAPGHYDRFRNRLMFPIGDATGRTIGFGARRLDPEDEPKYLNSPETPLFSKGRCFYGLAQAREAIRSERTAVILEGYTDVIMAHQAGVTSAVAVLGTALTQEHARALARLAERVALVFDPDEAGRRSARRSIQVLLPEALEVHVAGLPEGQDPCEFVRAEGGEAFRRRLEQSEDFFEFSLRCARAERDVKTVQGRAGALRELQGIADVLRGRAEYDPFVQRAAEELGIAERLVRREFQRGASVRRPAAVQGEGGGAAARLRAEESLPQELLGLLLAHPDLAPEAAARADLEAVPDCPAKEALARLLERARTGRQVTAREFVASLDDGELASSAARAVAEEERREQKIALADAATRLQGYLEYMERRLASTAAGGQPASDDELRDYVRRLKERDRESAKPE